jgi:hypothetical protein
MAFYLHTEDRVIDQINEYDLENMITRGEVRKFLTRADAFRAKTDSPHLVVTFHCTVEERYAWHERESDRFNSGMYARVPWANVSWYRYDDTFSLLFAHMSLNHIGLIAYTPDDESGFCDRQLRVTPARFLQKFCADHLNEKQIAEYVALVKGFDGKFSLATTEDDVIAVYRGGPHSCMSHDVDEYSTRGIHPVSVYAGSDLAVAYLGDKRKASARCIVWPEKKFYTRVYGDTTLRVVLEKDGYQYTDSVDGAKVRAIKLNDPRHRRSLGGYVMPFMDTADRARLTSDGKFFVFDESGSYGTRETNGTTGIVEDEYRECANCGDSYESNDDTDPYCRSCDDDRWTCDACDDVSFDPSDQHRVGNDTLCESCSDERSTSCEECSDHFHEENYTRHQQRDRSNRGVTAFCESCESGHSMCNDCGSALIPDDQEYCDDCKPSHEDDDDQDPENVTKTEDAPVVDPEVQATMDLLILRENDQTDQETYVSMRDHREPSSRTLGQALTGSTWQEVMIDSLHCLIARCQKSLVIGSVALRASNDAHGFHGGYYCHECATRLQDRNDDLNRHENHTRLIPSMSPRIQDAHNDHVAKNQIVTEILDLLIAPSDEGSF